MENNLIIEGGEGIIIANNTVSADFDVLARKCDLIPTDNTEERKIVLYVGEGDRIDFLTLDEAFAYMFKRQSGSFHYAVYLNPSEESYASAVTTIDSLYCTFHSVDPDQPAVIEHAKWTFRFSGITFYNVELKESQVHGYGSLIYMVGTAFTDLQRLTVRYSSTLVLDHCSGSIKDFATYFNSSVDMNDCDFDLGGGSFYISLQSMCRIRSCKMTGNGNGSCLYVEQSQVYFPGLETGAPLSEFNNFAYGVWATRNSYVYAKDAVLSLTGVTAPYHAELDSTVVGVN